MLFQFVCVTHRKEELEKDQILLVVLEIGAIFFLFFQRTRSQKKCIDANICQLVLLTKNFIVVVILFSVAIAL